MPMVPAFTLSLTETALSAGPSSTETCGTQRLREMGLGGVAAVSLACARDRAAGVRAVLAAGKDPIAESKATDGDLPTFGSLANQFLAAMEPAWRNDKHRAQWRSTLSKQCKPLRNSGFT